MSTGGVTLTPLTPAAGVNTVTGQQILFKIAADCSELQTEYIAGVTSQTALIVRGIERDPHTSLAYGLARIVGSGASGNRQITAWNPGTQTVTLASAFATTAAVGNVLQVLGADARRRGLMFDAINEAIRQSWGVFGRETKGATSVTLDSGDALYDLPTDVGELWQVGVLESAGHYDMRPEMNLWRMGGNAGAYTIEFLQNGGTFLPAKWAGQTLYAHYLDKEPEVDAESDTTRLPLDYFNLASYLYLLKRGAPLLPEGDAGKSLLQDYQTKLGQLKADADAARVRLMKGKPRRPQNVRYTWGR